MNNVNDKVKFIPYGKQHIDQIDIDAVIKVLNSDWLTQGPNIENFENSIAKYCGAKYAVAVSNATAALHISCLAAGLGKSDILWTSPNSFLASANCGLYCGANVDFIDIDEKTYNISVSALETKLIKAKQEKKLPKIVIPVHFAGQSCEMVKIKELSKEYGFIIIEDASHAIGGSYFNNKIGGCLYSDMTVFSFHPVKIITTAEGGMILTNNVDLYEKLKLFRCHGMTRDTNFMENESHGPWYYEQIDLGFNYRITDIQAALGISQLKKIDLFIKKRHELVKKYNIELQQLPITLPWQHPDTYSSYHLYVIRLKLDKLIKSHKQIFTELRNLGIGVNLHYIPIHTQPYYQKLGFKWGDFPESEKYYSEAISLPLYYDLDEESQSYVINQLKEVLL